MTRRLAFSLSGLALASAVLIGCGDVSHPVTTNGSTTLNANTQQINAARSISFLVDGNTNAKDLKSFIAAQVQNSSNPQIEYQLRQIDTAFAPPDGQYYRPVSLVADPADTKNNASTIYYTTAADVSADANFPNTGAATDLNAVSNFPEAKLYNSTFAMVTGYSNKHGNTTAYTGYGFDKPSALAPTAFGDFNPRTVSYTPPTKILDDPKTPGKPLDTFLLYVIPQDPAFAAFGIRIHLDLNVVITPGTPSTIPANTSDAPVQNKMTFQATVPGDGMNRGVTWSIAPSLEGTGGSLDPKTGVFVAPLVSAIESNTPPADKNTPVMKTYTVTATSVTQPDKTALATITVNGVQANNIGFRAATVKPSRTH